MVSCRRVSARDYWRVLRQIMIIDDRNKSSAAASRSRSFVAFGVPGAASLASEYRGAFAGPLAAVVQLSRSPDLLRHRSVYWLLVVGD